MAAEDVAVAFEVADDVEVLEAFAAAAGVGAAASGGFGAEGGDGGSAGASLFAIGPRIDADPALARRIPGRSTRK